MRMHIELDDELVRRVDAFAGPRGRSRFVREAVLASLDQRRRAELVKSVRGAITGEEHEWDRDPAAWVRAQRRGQRRRVG